MNETDIARQLLACAARAGNSEQKRTHFIDLPRLVLGLARGDLGWRNIVNPKTKPFTA